MTRDQLIEILAYCLGCNKDELEISNGLLYFDVTDFISLDMMLSLINKSIKEDK